MIEKIAVLLAGGVGLRAGGTLPKQLHTLCGRPLLWWSIKAFHDEDPRTQLIVVMHPDWFNRWIDLLHEIPEPEQYTVKMVRGGATRTESVANAIEAARLIYKDHNLTDALIAIHDGARPCVSGDLIRRGWERASQSEAAIPAIPLTDSIRRVYPDGRSEVEDRTLYRALQTPQVFRFPLLAEAYDRRDPAKTYTDDASVVEPFHPIALFDGDPDNLKVTYPRDFKVASLLLSR